MIKLVMSCIWICFVALISSYLAASWKSNRNEQGPNVKEASSTIELKKTPPLNIPMVRNGNVEGYIVVQFDYTIDVDSNRKLGASSELYIQDEAFRSLYAGQIDLGHLENYDLLALTKHLVSAVNLRLGGEPIKDVLIDQFNFIPKRELSK